MLALGSECLMMFSRPLQPTALQATDLYRIQVFGLRDYAMFIIDPQGILQSWNAGVEQLLGYSEQEWIGRPASIIFTPADKAAEVCESEMRLARGKPVPQPTIRWHRRKDGTELFANGVYELSPRRAGRSHRLCKDPQR
jgi:PAS domain S-box-containing protein